MKAPQWDDIRGYQAGSLRLYNSMSLMEDMVSGQRNERTSKVSGLDSCAEQFTRVSMGVRGAGCRPAGSATPGEG